MSQINAKQLSLGYGKNRVVHSIDLKIKKGEFVSIIGPSGAGKSTLLMSLNATTSVLGGHLEVLGENVSEIGTTQLKNLRKRIGVIFQCCNLVPRLSVFDNIASGMLQRKSTLAALIKYYNKQQYDEVYQYLKTFGIEEQALNRCDRLSGGQKQRVAIARATAQQPEIILADEPISSLDPVSARKVMETLKNANEKYGITVISNLHQLDYAREFSQRMIGIKDGRIVFDGTQDSLTQADVQQIYQQPEENLAEEICLEDVCCPGVAVNA